MFVIWRFAQRFLGWAKRLNCLFLLRWSIRVYFHLCIWWGTACVLDWTPEIQLPLQGSLLQVPVHWVNRHPPHVIQHAIHSKQRDNDRNLCMCSICLFLYRMTHIFSTTGSRYCTNVWRLWWRYSKSGSTTCIVHKLQSIQWWVLQMNESLIGMH